MSWKIPSHSGHGTSYSVLLNITAVYPKTVKLSTNNFQNISEIEIVTNNILFFYLAAPCCLMVVDAGRSSATETGSYTHSSP